MYIPETPQELTPQWLTSVLTEGGVLTDQTVVEASCEQLGEGEGFLGDILRITPSYNRTGKGPRSFIVKLPKLANRAMGELLGAYERENMFYMDMAAELPLRTPTMYYGEFDRDKASENQEPILRFADRLPQFLSGAMTNLAMKIAAGKKRRYILVMEDVVDANPGDQLTGASLDKAERALSTIAQAHAKYWETPQLSEKFYLLPLDIDARMRHSMFKRAQPAFKQTFSSAVDAGLLGYLERVTTDGVSMMRQLCNAPITLLHGDFRLDNLFFQPDDVIVFDWQLVRRGPAAYDLAYFLSGALDEGIGADEVTALLASYQRRLAELGVEGYSLADLERDYALALHCVLYSVATTDQVEMGDGRGADLMRSWIDRLHARLRNCVIH